MSVQPSASNFHIVSSFGLSSFLFRPLITSDALWIRNKGSPLVVNMQSNLRDLVGEDLFWILGIFKVPQLEPILDLCVLQFPLS